MIVGMMWADVECVQTPTDRQHEGFEMGMDGPNGGSRGNATPNHRLIGDDDDGNG